MAWGKWDIGLEIQEDGIRALAKISRARGVSLCRWWYLELPAGCIANGRIAQPEALTKRLTEWRRELPLYHTVRLAFPACRTLIRQIPAPATRLSETECQRYVVGATARQLGLAPRALSLDYSTGSEGKEFTVTAAQESELSQLKRCVTQARLNLIAVTPDASALCAFIPALTPPLRGLVTWHAGKWYLARHAYWSWSEEPAITSFEQACALLNLPLHDVAWCNLPGGVAPPSAASFDPWCVFTHLQPPLPQDLASWAIVIALAIQELAS